MGRGTEVERLVSALRKAAANGAAAAISGIRGLGGIGKTELAYAVAAPLLADFPDAQLFLDLRGSRGDPVLGTQALQTVIWAFEPLAQLPDEPAQLRALYRSRLTGKRVLLLLDDARDAGQVQALLPPPGSALLVTSRNRFTLPGMTALDLGTLPPHQAEALLLGACPRLGTTTPRLARLCGYLALALQLSAHTLANDDALRVEEYLERLERERLRHLRDPDAPADDSGASMEASLRLSYEALSAPAQTALCRLSIFPTAFDQQVAVAVADSTGLAEGPAGQELVAELRRRSLLECNEATQQYALHDLVRVFAAHRLDRAAPEVQRSVRLRAAQWYLEATQEQVDRLAPGAPDGPRPASVREDVLAIPAPAAAPVEALAWLERERENVVASVQWAFQAQAWELVWRLAEAAVPFFSVRQLWREWERTQHLAVLASRECGDRQAEGRALNNLGNVHERRGQSAKARTCWQAALTVLPPRSPAHEWVTALVQGVEARRAPARSAALGYRLRRLLRAAFGLRQDA